MHVLSTAGHVDHGKSSLILALTGTDPDRWKEEKERGLTIDLGFAHLKLPSGKELSLVDVPGHIRFIKNMLAGIGAIDGTIFVVAANELWKPQSEEHLRILDLLGTRSGIIALTKADLVDEEWLELARLDVQDHVAGTFLESAPIVEVDSISGRGLDELIAKMEDLLASTPTAADLRRPRLWIDRVFSSKGSGTVVTGTLTGGNIRINQDLAIFHSSGKSWNVLVSNLTKGFVEAIGDLSSKVKVRGMQSHGTRLEIADPGRRLALNLLGISSEEVSRGDVLIDSSQWCATSTFDADIKVLADLGHGVSKKGAYAIYVGSGDFPAKIGVTGKGELEPGETGTIRVHLSSLVPLCAGDRFILRELGRRETVAGGVVSNVNPRSPLKRLAAEDLAIQIIEERGYVESQLLYKMTGEVIPPNISEGYIISESLRAKIERDLKEKALSAGELGFEISELDEIARSVLEVHPDLHVDSARVRSSKFRQIKDALSEHPYLKNLENSLFKPPPPDEVDRQELRELVRRGLVIECDGIYYSPVALAKAKEAVWKLARENERGFTVAQLRDELDTSRKYLLALVGYLDSHGITRRSGDFRKPGPVLAREFKGR